MRATFRFMMLALLLLCGLYSQPQGRAQEKPAEEPLPAEKWPEAPAEMVAAFVKAVKATSNFQSAEALRRDKVEGEIDKWRMNAGLDTYVEWQSYLLEYLQEGFGSVELPGKGKWNLQTRETYEGSYTREFLVLEEAEAEPSRGYRISVATLKDLDVQFARWIIIRNPLNRVIGGYSAHNEQLATVVASLCKEAAAGRSNVDYVVRSDPNAQVQISMKVSGCTVFDGLLLAARSAGWNVYLNPDPRSDKEQSSTRASNHGVHWNAASEFWVNREMLNLRDKIQPPVETPLDAFRECFQREVKRVLAERYVVMLKPAKKE